MAQLSHLLLFDPDPDGLGTLTYGLEKEGCSVTGTGDPAQARELIQNFNPALVVVNLRDGDQSGLALLRGIVADPGSRNVACVAMGREDLREAALSAGALLFLSVPLFVRDILSACRMVAAASVVGSPPSRDAEASVKLADLDGMYFLVRALAATGRSAVVEVRRDGVRAELRFLEGNLASAHLGAVEGLPALHHMLLWDDATLHFKFKNVARRGTQLSLKSGEVTEECDRFLRDFAHEVKDLGFARTVYDADSERVQPSSALPNEVLPLLRLFDGQRTLLQVLDESPFRIFDTLKIIKRFADGEAIRPTTPLPPPIRDGGAALTGPAALDFWLQRQAAAPSVATETTNPGFEAAPPVPVSGADGGTAHVGLGIRAGGAPGARPSSPFIAVPEGEVATKRRGGSVPGRRKRTITRKEHVPAPAPLVAPEDIVTPPPVLVSEEQAAAAGEAVPVAAAPAVAARLLVDDSAPTPPPVIAAPGDVSHASPSVVVLGNVGQAGTPAPVLNVPSSAASDSAPAPAPVGAATPLPVLVGAATPAIPTTPAPVLVAPTTPPPVIVVGASTPATPRPVILVGAPASHGGAIAAAGAGADSDPDDAADFAPAAPGPSSGLESPPSPLVVVTDQTADVANSPVLKPAAAVATGEIHVADPTPAPQAGAAVGIPSVVVEIANLPVPMPMAAVGAAPISAQSAAPPSVIIAPMTPAPVVTARQRNNHPPAAGAIEAKRNQKSPSDNFNALESDFFEREADLYKRESVESFEDLDGASRTANRPNGPVRKE